MNRTIRTITGLALLAVLGVTTVYTFAQQIVRYSADIVVDLSMDTAVAQIRQRDDVAVLLDMGNNAMTATLDSRSVGGVNFLVQLADGSIDREADNGAAVSTVTWPSGLPGAPKGLLGDTQRRTTWQPEKGLRFAARVDPMTVGGRPVYIVGFTNLAPYERVTSNLTHAWLAIVAGIGVLGLGAATFSQRKQTA